MSPPRRKDGGAGKESAGTGRAGTGNPGTGGAKVGAGRCPICKRPRDETFKPFCSKRCADLDLARWLDGRYTIPASETSDDESAFPAKPQDEEE